MAKNLLTECPYCHRKVSYFGAGVLKTKGEHCCSGCKCISNVVIHRALYGIGGIAVVLSLIFVLTLSTYMAHDNIWGIIIVFLPYLIFYIVCPFFIKLEPCNDKSAVNKLKRKLEPVLEDRKQHIKKQEKPIELNVGEQFSSNFMKAKTSMKSADENYSEEYSENLFPTDGNIDINSGIDIDISADVKKENDKSNAVKDVSPVYEAPEPEKRTEETLPDSSGEVSFMYQNTNSQKDEINEENDVSDVSDVKNENEVSFIYGKPDDENDI